MHLIKLKDVGFKDGYCYIVAEQISSFYYDKNKDSTFVFLQNGAEYRVNGDVMMKLAKIITSATNGTFASLE